MPACEPADSSVAGELRTAGSGEGAPDGGETRPRPDLSAAALLGLFPLFVVLGALIKFRSMVLNAEGFKPRFGTTPPLVDVARARARGHARAHRTLEVGLLRGGDARGRPTTLELKHLIRRRRRLHRCPPASARQGLGGEPGAAPERPGTNGSITARGRAARTARASASARSARTAISGVCSAPADASGRPGRISEDTSTLPPWPAPRRYGGGGPGCRTICGKFAVDERETTPASSASAFRRPASHAEPEPRDVPKGQEEPEPEEDGDARSGHRPDPRVLTVTLTTRTGDGAASLASRPGCRRPDGRSCSSWAAALRSAASGPRALAATSRMTRSLPFPAA